MELLIIIWLLSAVVCAMIASSKGQSVATYAMLGLLLGFIGIIIAVLAENKAN